MKIFKFFISKIFWIQVLAAVVLSFLLVFIVSEVLEKSTNQEQKIEVPDLSKFTEEEVKVILDEIKLRYTINDTGAYNPEFPKGSVLFQIPKAGSIVKEKRMIYLTLNPYGYAETNVPKFYGKTKKEIEQIIKNSGFVIGEYIEIDDIGTVVRKLRHHGRELKEGDKLPKMSKIDIVIGNGKLN